MHREVRHEVPRRLASLFPRSQLPERDGVLRDYLAQRAGTVPEREFPLFVGFAGGRLCPVPLIAEDSEGKPLPPPDEKSETREANKEEVRAFFARRCPTQILRDRPGWKHSASSRKAATAMIVRSAVAIFPKCRKRIRDDDSWPGTWNRRAGILDSSRVSAIGNLPAEFR